MNNLKRINSFVLAIILLVTLCSCNEKKQIDITSYFQKFNFESLEYVELCNYKNISVSSDYVKVSDSDIITVIEMDMEYYDCMKSTELTFPEEDFYVFLRIDDIKNHSSREQYYLFGSEEFGEQFESTLKDTEVNEYFFAEIEGIESKITNMGIFEPATVEDEKMVLDFYKLESMNAVYEHIRQKTRTNIIFNYMMDIILENSTIVSLPSEISTSYDEYSASFWNDILIYKAILEKEGKELTISEFEEEVNIASQENNITISTVLTENADSVLHFALEQKLKNILVDYINISYD